MYFVPLTNRQQVTIRIKESTHREKEKRGARTSIAFALKAPSAAQRRSCFNIYGISPLLIDEYIDSHMPETPSRQSSIWLNRLNLPLQTSDSTHSDPVLVHQPELPAVPDRPPPHQLHECCGPLRRRRAPSVCSSANACIAAITPH